MDKRLQHIAEHFDEMKIGPDEPFRFHCTECGKCCIHREDILLSPYDLFRAARELGMRPLDFFKRYCESYIGQDSRIPIIRLKPQGNVRRCPLLKDRHCMIHKAKPSVCAMFPVGRGVAAPKGSDLRDVKEASIQFILQPPECGDDSETHTVREWLASFGMEVEDPIYVAWQRYMMFAHDKTVKLEKALSPEEMDRFWTLTSFCVYINYDTKEEFLPQYQKNLQDAVKLIQAYENAALGVKPNAV